jgi:hypothetical protein
MQTGFVRVLLMTLAASWLVGCTQTEPAAAPPQSEAKNAQHSDSDQQALERRRLRLQGQVLAELRKLRQSRQASTGAAEPASDEETAAPAVYELEVYGGASHEVFLGCLCDQHRGDSIFNMIGEHGSDLAQDSIRNKFAPYGSDTDDTSACNPVATHPPVVVASDGKSLGLLSVNPSLKRRITSPGVADWLARMCGI